MGNGTAGVGGQRHRRGDIRHDAEVENKHMRRQQRDSHLDEDGRSDGGHNDIIGGGGNAHAQHNAGQHGAEQRQEDALLRQGNDDGDQGGAQGGHRNDARDDARHGAGYGHADGAGGAALQALRGQAGGQDGGFGQEAAQDSHHHRHKDRSAHSHPDDLPQDDEGCQRDQRQTDRAQQVVLILADQADDKGEQNGKAGGHAGGVVIHADDQDDDRQQQIAASGQQPEELRHGPFGQALQAQPLGFKVHHQKDAGKIQHGGQNGRHDDGGVGNAGDLGHQKGRGAHDGRHDLSAGGSGGLHRGGKFRSVAHLLHGGDGDAAAADGVGDRGAGVHPHQCAGDDRHLGRAAHAGARDGVGQVDKEGADAGLFQKGAENDEQHDKGGADGDGGRKDAAVQVVEQVIDQVAQGGFGIVAGQPPGAVNGKQTYHHDKRDTRGTAAQLHQQQNADDTQNDLEGADAVCHLNDLLLGDGVIEIHAQRGYRQHDIIPGEVVIPQGVPLAGRVFKVAHKQRHADENRQTGVLRGAGNDQRHGDHGDGIQHEQHRHCRFIAAGQGAAFAVPVQLLQQLGRVGSIRMVQGMRHSSKFLSGGILSGHKRGTAGGRFSFVTRQKGKAAAGTLRFPPQMVQLDIRLSRRSGPLRCSTWRRRDAAAHCRWSQRRY